MAYKSKLEERIATQLTEAAVPVLYEKVRLHYTLSKSYKPDFILPNGIFIEAKGWHKGFAESVRQKLHVRKCNPDLELRWVLESPNVKLGKQTLSTWLRKNGFVYAIGEIPLEWFNEPGPYNTKYWKGKCND